MWCKAVFGITATLNRCMILTMVLILALSLTGCGANLLNNKDSTVRSIIWQQHDQFVRIEGQDRDSILVPANDHPAILSANLVRKTLGSLEVLFEGEEKPVPVFSQDELEILGEAVSSGLAQAGPHEDITCAIAGIHRRHTALDISTYRFFIENERLNLIIGTLHRKYTENIDRSRYALVPGGRKYTPPDQLQTTTGWTIVPQAGMKFKTNGAITSDVYMRQDWLILNPTANSFLKAAQVLEDSAQLEAEKQEINQKIEAIQRSIKQMKQTTTIDTPMAAPTPVGSMEQDKIEQRLQILQQLINKGLINGDDFRSKKQEILDSL